jgi:hypothetical protein
MVVADGRTSEEIVETLAANIFKDQQQRMAHNILLKTYDFFLVKL